MNEAKRKLSNFSFESEGSHVALVGKFQGGPANGVTTLVTKATNDISQEEVKESLSQVDKGMSSEEGVTNQTEGKTLSDNVEKQEDIMSEEMIAKSVMDAEITKAVDLAVAEVTKAYEEKVIAKQAELDAALEVVKSLKAKEKESVQKSRKEALKGAGLADDEVEELYKSTEALPTESFDMIVKAMAAKEKAIAESDLLKEVGLSGQAEAVEELDGVAALTKSLEQKYKTKKEAK